MIPIYIDDINIKLYYKFIKYYFLCGNNVFLINESEKFIINYFKYKYYINICYYTIDKNINWKKLFFISKTNDFFYKKKILILKINMFFFNNLIEHKMLYFSSILNNKNIIIIHINDINIQFYNNKWFNYIKKKTILINCKTPYNKKMFIWVKKRSKKNNLLLEDKICKILCDYYQDDLFSLSNILIHLSYIYSNNKKINKFYLLFLINYISNFNLSNLIDSIFKKKFYKSMHILFNLKIQKIDPVVILRFIQNKLIFLITLKINNNNNLLDNLKFKNVIFFIMNIELNIKMNKKYYIWNSLENLIFYLCFNNINKNILLL